MLSVKQLRLRSAVMYLLYKIKKHKKSHSFEQIEGASIAGNQSGLIVQYLREHMPEKVDDYYPWHISVTEALDELGWGCDALIVDLKPNAKSNVSLYQILNVYGHSDASWTPILLHLRELLVDASAKKYSKKKFNIPGLEEMDSIFTFLYLQGGIENGKIKGTWNFPRPSSTNSALLWPAATDYFMRQIMYARGELPPGADKFKKDYYVKLRRRVRSWLNRRKIEKPTSDYILLIPDFFYLLVALTLDPRIPAKDKLIFAAIIAYFINPIDVIPDFLVPPVGYLDDLYLAIYALNRFIGQGRRPENKPIVTELWPGDPDTLIQLQSILEWLEGKITPGILGELKQFLNNLFKKGGKKSS